MRPSEVEAREDIETVEDVSLIQAMRQGAVDFRGRKIVEQPAAVNNMHQQTSHAQPQPGERQGRLEEGKSVRIE